MSEVLKSGAPQCAVSSKEQQADDETPAPGTVEDVGVETAAPVVSSAPVAKEKDRVREEPAPVALVPGDAARHESQVLPAKTVQRLAPSGSVPLASGVSPASAAPERSKAAEESPIRKSVVEEARVGSSGRRVSRVAVAAAAILAAFAIGPGGTSVPPDAPRIASLVPAAYGPPEVIAKASAQTANPVEHAAPSPAPNEARALEEPEPEKEGPTADALNFRDAALCTDARCKTLLVQSPQNALRPVLQPAVGAAVGIVDMNVEADVSVFGHVAIPTPAPAEPPAPTDTNAPSETSVPPLQKTDMPREEKDEGAGDRVLQIPLDDLGEVEFVLLPKDATDTSHARVALRQRDGGEIARFDLKVDHTLIADVPVLHDDDQHEQKKENDEELTSGADDDEAESRDPAAAEVPPVVRSTKKRAPRAERKAATRRARKAQPGKQPAKKGVLSARVPAQRAPAAPQPRGLFPLQPPPSSVSDPASRQAAPALQKKRSAEVSSNDLASQPTPRTRGRPPGFETLMSLGGGFAVASP